MRAHACSRAVSGFFSAIPARSQGAALAFLSSPSLDIKLLKDVIPRPDIAAPAPVQAQALLDRFEAAQPNAAMTWDLAQRLGLLKEALLPILPADQKPVLESAYSSVRRELDDEGRRSLAASLQKISADLAASPQDSVDGFKPGSLFHINAKMRSLARARFLAHEPRWSKDVEILKARLAQPASDASRPLSELFHKALRWVVPEIPIELEQKDTTRFFSHFFKTDANDPAALAVLQPVADRLARNRKRQNLSYRLGLLHDAGTMAFGRGADRLVLSDEAAQWPADEQAGVIAHEMAHNEQRHFIKLLVLDEIYEVLTEVLGAPPTHPALHAARLKFMRQTEFEADGLGARLMRLAGYSPQGLAAVLRKIAAAERPASASKDSDHPLLQKRIDNLLKR
jgi:Zn-dependent protease with chaperone function